MASSFPEFRPIKISWKSWRLRITRGFLAASSIRSSSRSRWRRTRCLHPLLTLPTNIAWLAPPSLPGEGGATSAIEGTFALPDSRFWLRSRARSFSDRRPLRHREPRPCFLHGFRAQEDYGRLWHAIHLQSFLRQGESHFHQIVSRSGCSGRAECSS